MDIKEILFSYLYQIAEQHNLTVHIEEESSPIPTCTISEKKSIFLNYTGIGERYHAFQFAHELGHYLNGDREHCECDGVILDIKREYYANKTGTRLLLTGLSKNNIYFSSLYDLLEFCGIPFDMVTYVNQLVKYNYPTLIPSI